MVQQLQFQPVPSVELGYQTRAQEGLLVKHGHQCLQRGLLPTQKALVKGSGQRPLLSLGLEELQNNLLLFDYERLCAIFRYTIPWSILIFSPDDGVSSGTETPSRTASASIESGG